MLILGNNVCKAWVYMDKELKERSYDISIKTEMRTTWEYAGKQFNHLYKNTHKFVFVSYRQPVIRESRLYIIQLPVIKSECDILQQLN